MPQFEFEIGIFLLCCALVSIAVFLFESLSQEGKLKLPTHGEDFLNVALEIDDPFDVTKPEDIIDGDPIRENEFWAAVSNSMFNRHLKQILTSDLFVLRFGLGKYSYP